MNKSNLKNNIPKGFIKPTSLPQSEEESAFWQKANLSWWEDNPMRYDWKEKIGAAEFTKQFYKEIDKRFFKNAKEYLKDNKILPFAEFIDFGSLKNQDVLEIGIGNGTHAQLLASYAKSFIGIDITEYAVKSTKERMKLFGLKADIRQIDAEKMPFKDNSFDFIWSWGVIHHSANPQKILEEIYRVLRPEGIATIMVYHRGWWNYYIIGFLRAILNGDFFKGCSLAESMQLNTDGAIARYYSKKEWKNLVGEFLYINNMMIMGPKTDIIPLPAGIMKNLTIKIIPTQLNKFFTRNLRMGSFLVSKLQKKQS